MTKLKQNKGVVDLDALGSYISLIVNVFIKKKTAYELKYGIVGAKIGTRNR